MFQGVRTLDGINQAIEASDLTPVLRGYDLGGGWKITIVGQYHIVYNAKKESGDLQFFIQTMWEAEAHRGKLYRQPGTDEILLENSDYCGVIMPLLMKFCGRWYVATKLTPRHTIEDVLEVDRRSYDNETKTFARTGVLSVMDIEDNRANNARIRGLQLIKLAIAVMPFFKRWASSLPELEGAQWTRVDKFKSTDGMGKAALFDAWRQGYMRTNIFDNLFGWLLRLLVNDF